ncbi:Eco57I restriction-modification methylase domain-containing protein [Adlercreutzia agrestimuris]|uniref:Eco57I restriction-modification methylase domain-containing protein n=1 Tax=Adlercreutzia agrestimuris TaxID=2941324 RepID=UPI00203DD8EF|nr:Eco57I restriction-modification methylase domain-containing protein [Adlercreutzia agrestimuris]
MLNDPHLKVLLYEADCSKIFPGQDIKGGIAISYRDSSKFFGEIKTFTAFPQMNSILKKVDASKSLAEIIYIQNRFDLDALYSDFPEAEEVIGSNGKDKRFEKNIFKKVQQVFLEEEVPDAVKVLGIVDNKREWRYILQKYVDMSHENIKKWKVLIPTSNGSGALGEVLSTPLIGAPLIGYTRSFIAVGAFETEAEAQSALKYVKSKFCRVLLGALKVTQDNNKEVWVLIPLQDFTSSSDIDWSQSVAEIDEQLYKKYGLSQEEIDFIETHVKEMD